MSQPAYAKTYPFNITGQKADEAQWRRLFGALGDGLVNDLDGTSFAVTPSASDRTITVDLNELRTRGIHFEGQSASSPLTITLPSVSAGFTRCDRIIAHYDPTDRSIVIEPLVGSPVNTGAGTEPIPALTEASGGIWELPLWRFTGGNVAAASLTKVDERSWVGQSYTVPSQAQLALLTCQIYAKAYTLDNGHEWRLLPVSGTPTWVDIDDPGLITWTSLNGLAGGAGSLIPFDTPLQFGRSHGFGMLHGSIQRAAGLGNLVAATGGDTTIGTLPAGYRPANVVRFACAGGSAGFFSRVSVFASGVVNATPNGLNPTPWLAFDGCRWPLA